MGIGRFWRVPLRVLTAGVLVVGLAACSDEADPEAGPSTTLDNDTDEEVTVPDDETTTTVAEVDDSGPTNEIVELRDPVEDAFTVNVPKGWLNEAYSTGEFDVHREVVTSVSPDGGTVLFIGDPKIPNFWNPATANPITVQFAEVLDYMELRSYSPAQEFFAEYANQKYGELPGFEITSVEPNDAMADGFKQQAAAAGLSAPVAHGATVRFTHVNGDKTMSGALFGLTADLGDFWITDVSGISTERDVDDYVPMLREMTHSKVTNPEWTQRQNERHQATMEEIQRRTEAMTQQHYANMAWIQDSAARHQSRMEAIWAAGDASVRSFQERMASSDNTHRQFLNYVNDEYTVVNSSGQAFQVDDGYETYYMNTTDNTYVGGDINFDDQTLLELGLNPSDYEKVEIKP
jgi:hypothetical protein